MYGSIKTKTLLDGVLVGKYAGILSEPNLGFIQKLAQTYSKVTETGLCNRILNEKLDELRDIHERLIPALDPNDDEIDNLFANILGDDDGPLN